MKHISKFAAAGFIGAVMATAAVPAQSALVCGAGVCADSVTFGPAATEIVNGNVLLPLFDSNLGVLTGATITFTAQAEVKAGSTLTNNSAQSQSFSVKQDVIFSITDLTSPGGALDLAVQALALIPTTGLKAFANVPGTGSAPANTVAFGPFTNSSGANLAAALSALQAAGGGTETLGINTITLTSFVGGGGNIAANVVTDGALTININYTFTDFPVPEPMSIALLGMGLAGLGAARFNGKRRNSQDG